jgi:hypothetical protein
VDEFQLVLLLVALVRVGVSARKGEKKETKKMTKKTTPGGQSLLINGAFRMAKSKRAPSTNQNHNHSHQELTILESTKHLRAAIEHHNRRQHILNTSDSHGSPPIGSMSGFASPNSPIHENILTNKTIHHHQLDQHNNSKQNNQSQINGKNKKLFPQKLWDLINDQRYSFCLRWSDDGQLVYLNRDEFEDSYLKTGENQFHTQKAISFVRQMNMYGFRKVDDCYYENDNFKRGCEHLLKNMTRKHPSKTSTGTIGTSTTASSTTSALGTGHDLSSFLFHKTTTTVSNQETNLHLNLSQPPEGPSRFVNQFQQQQQPQAVDCSMRQRPPPVGAVNPLASLFNGGLSSSQGAAAAARRTQPFSEPSVQQPVDLVHCAKPPPPPQLAGVGVPAGSGQCNQMQADGDQHNDQNLNSLIESQAAIVQANLLMSSMRQQQQQRSTQLKLASFEQRHQQPVPMVAGDEPASDNDDDQHGDGEDEDEAMDLELDVMSSPDDEHSHNPTSNEHTPESLTPVRPATPQIDPTNININLNVAIHNNLMNQLQEQQSLSLPPRQSQEQQLFNTIQLFRLLVALFTAQNGHSAAAAN